MIDEPAPKITDDMSDDEKLFIETRSQRQPEYVAPGYNDPKSLDGVLRRDKDSLIYSYVTEYQFELPDTSILNI